MIVVKVLFVAVALALDVFAVSIGVGVRGVPAGVKVRIGLAFAGAEVTMNLIGAGIGAVAGRLIGDIAGYVGFVGLVGLGIYMMYESKGIGEESNRLDLSQGWGLFLAALSISLDSLGIGFSIVYIGAPLAFTLAVIAVVSLLATASGLTLGRRFGELAGSYAAFGGGLILALTGVTFIILKAMHAG